MFHSSNQSRHQEVEGPRSFWSSPRITFGGSITAQLTECVQALVARLPNNIACAPVKIHESTHVNVFSTKERSSTYEHTSCHWSVFCVLDIQRCIFRSLRQEQLCKHCIHQITLGYQKPFCNLQEKNKVSHMRLARVLTV